MLFLEADKMSTFEASITTAFFAFFAIMNPVANAPIFLGLVGDVNDRTRREIAIRSVLIAFVVAAGFAALGHLVMRLFGISLPALQIFGGVLVARIGFDLIMSSQSPAHSASSGGDQPGFGIAVSPLAVPILAGPGTLATAATLSASGQVEAVIGTVVGLAAVCMLTLIAFLLADSLVRFLGHELIAMVAKLMGLMLGVVGVQLLVDGVREVLLNAAA